MLISSFTTAIKSLAAPARVLGFLLLVLTLSRIVLIGWFWDRVAPTGGTGFILLQGIRFDLVLMGMLLGPALLAAPWLSGRKFGVSALRFYLLAVTLYVMWVELGTIPYIDQYDARPNYIYVEYLKYPREIFSMLMASYGLLMVLIAVITVASGLFAWRLSRSAKQTTPGHRFFGALFLMPILVVMIFAMIRSTTDHHPVNPSTVAFTTDSMVNQLALNSPYTLIYAIYEQNRDSRTGNANYGKMNDADVLRIVTEKAGLTDVVEQRIVNHQVVVLLGVITRMHLVTPVEVADVCVGFAGEDAQQAGLASAVEAEHEQSLALAEVEADVFEDRWPAVALAQPCRRDDGVAALRRRRESDVHRLR